MAPIRTFRCSASTSTVVTAPAHSLPGLARSRTYTWTWANVAAGINMCMKEGKNK